MPGAPVHTMIEKKTGTVTNLVNGGSITTLSALDTTITVATRRAVLVSYVINWDSAGAAHWMTSWATVLQSGSADAEVPGSTVNVGDSDAIGAWHTNQATSVLMLDAGTYTFKILYQATGVRTPYFGSDWERQSLSVTQL